MPPLMKTVSSLVFLLLTFQSIGQNSRLSNEEVYQLHDSAIYLLDRAQLPQAIPILKKVSRPLLELEEYDKYFEGQYYLAVSYHIMDRNPEGAEDSLKTNLDLAIKLAGEHSLAASEMYFGLGWLFDNTARRRQGEEYYQKAYQIQSQLLGQSDKKLLKTITNYAQTLSSNGKYGRTEGYLNQLLEQYPVSYPANHPEYIRLYALAFQFYNFTNQQSKALEYALASYHSGIENYGQDNPRMLSLLRNLSQAYDAYYQTEKGVEFAFKELALIKRLIGDAPHQRKAEVLNNIGRFHSKTNNDSSILYLQEALDMKIAVLGKQNSSTINSMINLASTLSQNGQLEKAGNLLAKVEEIHSEIDTDLFTENPFRARLIFAENFYNSNTFDSIPQLVFQGMELFASRVSPEIYSGVLHTVSLDLVRILIDATIVEGWTTETNPELEQIVVLMDSINQHALTSMSLRGDQLNFLSEYSEFNRAVIDLYYQFYQQTGKNKYIEKMYLFSEKNKATVLSPEFAVASLKDQLNIPLKLLEEERQIASDLSLFKDSSNVSRLEKLATYDSLKKVLQNNYPEYYATKYQREELPLNEVEQHLQKGHQIVSYSTTNDYLYAFSIKRGDVGVRRAEKEKVEELGKQLRDAIENLEETTAITNMLYTKLIPEEVEENISLILSTEGYLTAIPFEVLTNDGIYLGATNPLSYTPSIGMWFETKKHPLYASSKVLGIAPAFKGLAFNSEVSREVLVQIPGAKTEIENLSKILDGEWLVDEQANRQNFLEKLPEFGIVHMATHAIVDEQDPDFSRLYLSEEANSTSYLSNHELYNLDINANLVTLSACNTGVGNFIAGEGVNSFARGFMYSGVPSVVASLWPASDKSTPELMKYFYQNLKGGQAKDVALNNARKQYLETATGKARHPFYWGGFVLIGDNRPIDEDSNMLLSLLPLGIATLVIVIAMRRRKVNAT